MAAAPLGGPVTISATAQSLLALLGLPLASRFYAELTVRASDSNAGRVWIGPSTVTSAGVNAYGFLLPAEALAVDLASMHSSLGDLYLVGTASDTCYVLAFA
jgi:hypothetical protein